jgi:two-component system sensor histidine kinase QseC
MANQQHPIKTKISSIRRFLTVSLLSLLTVVVAILALLNYMQLTEQNERLFQIQLVNSAQLLNAFYSVRSFNQIDQTNFNNVDRKTFKTLVRDTELQSSPDYLDFRNTLVFQVWNTLSGKLILRSPGAPSWPLNNISLGFSETIIHNKQKWHSFSLTNLKSHRRIIVGMRDILKHRINYNTFLHDLSILAVMYFMVAILLIVVIEVGLVPLKRMAMEVARRDAANLTRIDLSTVPAEVIPLAEEINELLDRIQSSITREKRFTADAAHELRTPLAALKTQAEVASKVEDPQQQKRILNNIITGTNRFAHIIEQLMTLSRLEPAQALPSIETINLNTLCEQAMADLGLLALNRHVELELHMPERPLLIPGNKPLMSVLFRNLIDNGIRYTPEHGRVMVIGSWVGGDVVIQVIDSGPGVPDRARERIFDRFYRQLGNNTEGSGLGLSIVKRIVDLHHASIEVKTPDRGFGLEMRVIFPQQCLLK